MKSLHGANKLSNLHVPQQAHFDCFPYWPVLLRLQVENIVNDKVRGPQLQTEQTIGLQQGARNPTLTTNIKCKGGPWPKKH